MNAKVIPPETPSFTYTPPAANGTQGELELGTKAYEGKGLLDFLSIGADGTLKAGFIALESSPKKLLLTGAVVHSSRITVKLPNTDTLMLKPVLPAASHLNCDRNLVLRNGAEQHCKITAGGDVTIEAQGQNTVPAPTQTPQYGGSAGVSIAIPPSTGMNVTVKAGGHIVGGVVAVGSHYEAGGDITLLRVESDHEKATCIQAKGALTLSEQKILLDGTVLSADRINIQKPYEIRLGVKISANQLTLGDKTYDLTQGSNSVKDATDKINSQYRCNITLEALGKGCDVSGNQNNSDGLEGRAEGGAGGQKPSWGDRTAAAVGLGSGCRSPG